MTVFEEKRQFAKSLDLIDSMSRTLSCAQAEWGEKTHMVTQGVSMCRYVVSMYK